MNGRPRLYLIVILPCLLGCFWLSVIAGLKALVLVGGYASYTEIPDINAALVCIPLIFVSIPASLLLGNGILHSSTTLRTIAEEYAQRCGRPSYRESQIKLLRLLLLTCLVCAPFIIAGFLLQ